MDKLIEMRGFKRVSVSKTLVPSGGCGEQQFSTQIWIARHFFEGGNERRKMEPASSAGIVKQNILLPQYLELAQIIECHRNVFLLLISVASAVMLKQ
jgi:hypothetical protein